MQPLKQQYNGDQAESEASPKKRRRAILAHHRATRHELRRVARTSLHEARWQYFLMEEGKMEAADIDCIVHQRSPIDPTTPPKLHDEFLRLRSQLQQRFIRGNCFPEEIPDGVAEKVQNVQSSALVRWKDLRHQTAIVDKSPNRKAHALQDTDRHAQAQKQAILRRYKTHRRMQRLQKRNRGIKEMLKDFANMLQGDDDLWALVKK